MHGCDNFCSDCIVPYVRGREVSRDPDEIRTEIRTHAAAELRQRASKIQARQQIRGRSNICIGRRDLASTALFLYRGKYLQAIQKRSELGGTTAVINI